MRGEEKLKIGRMKRQEFQSFMLNPNWENIIQAIKGRKVE